MCGIAGIISAEEVDLSHLEDMTDIMSHRGPDNRGFFRDKTVGLGHRRLSIIDLSLEANQPMQNEDGTLVLVFNGEIYNYKEKTAEMKTRGHTFRSKSDCEVLLHLYEEYGDDFLNEVNGMYAFAIWDSRKRRILCGVDRFGKKPLYYAVYDGRFVFASELKSLLLFKWVTREVDYQAIDRYLSLRHVPAPMTILESVKKLEPATIMVWKDGEITFKKYWNPVPKDNKRFDKRSIDAFEDVLTDAVRLRLQSDVPLGIYLSGGVDSAAIAALMKSFGGGKRVSYTVSFDYQYDESPRAKRIADHLGYEYNPVTIEENDFSFMPAIAYHMDEPFGDMLSLPAYLLAKKAKEKLTVVLTGDGADEILNGYFHQKLLVLWRRYNRFLSAPGVSKTLSKMVNLFPPSFLNHFFDYPDRIGRRERAKISQTLAKVNSFGTFYEAFTSCFTMQDKEKLYTTEMKSKLTGPPISEQFGHDIKTCADFSFLSGLSILDLKYWLPFSVIYRLDKMNMAHAVETRSPFLDYRVVEMALNLPDKEKLNGNHNKLILRRLIERLYPPLYREKGKQAFYMPLTPEYKKSYSRWVDKLLNKKLVEQRGLFRWPYIEGLLKTSRNSSMLASRQLTALAMLEQWFQAYKY